MGVSGGLLFMTRPVEGAIIGLTCGLWGFQREGRRVAGILLAGGLVAVVVTVPLFVNNRLLSGSALRNPIEVYFDETFYPGANALGFGPDKGNLGWDNNIFPGHSPFEAAINANVNLSLVDVELFGYPFGSVLPLVLFMIVAVPRRVTASRHQRGDTGEASPSFTPWVATVALTVGVTFVYWYSGADLGPRYWLLCVPAFAVLSVLGVFETADRLGLERRRAVALLALAGVFGASQVIPWRAANKYHEYRGMLTDIRDLRQKLGSSDLVVIRSTRQAVASHSVADYGAAIIWNEVPLEQGAIYARAVTDDDLRRLQQLYGNRRLWLIDAPSVTKGRYAVAISPQSPGDR
jgi:hypothetical protein